MELHEHPAAGVSGEVFGQLARQVGLAGSGRAVQDDLTLVVQEAEDVIQEGTVDQELLGQMASRSPPSPGGTVDRLLSQ